MRNIIIKDFGPIKRASIDLDGLVVLRGPHGVGKSMILEALMIGLYGQVSRLNRKSDLPELIRAGTRMATVDLSWDDFANEVKIRPTTKTCPSNAMSQAAKMQTGDPWINLAIAPASWRSILPSSTINLQAVESLVSDFPEAIRSLVLRSCSKGITGLVEALEYERTESGRQIREVPQTKDTAEINGQPVFLPDYAPFRAEYEKKVSDLLAQTGEYARRVHEINTFKTRLQAIEDQLSRVKDTGKQLRHLLSRENRAEYTKAIEVLSAGKPSKVCDTCKRPWSPEYDAAVAVKGNLEQLTSNWIRPDTRKKTAAMIRSHRNLIDQYKKAADTPLPEQPEPVDQWNQLVVALKTREYMIEEQKRILSKNLEAQDLKRNLQAAVELFRKPETLQKITSADMVDAIRARLAESCSILAIPKVGLSKSLDTEFEVSDGSLKYCGLMSDAQRAMAGMAIAEAVACVTKATDFLIVDKLDWVEGEHVGKLTAFLERASTWAKTVLVLTAKNNITPKGARTYQGSYADGGTEFSQTETG